MLASLYSEDQDVGLVTMDGLSNETRDKDDIVRCLTDRSFCVKGIRRPGKW